MRNQVLITRNEKQSEMQVAILSFLLFCFWRGQRRPGTWELLKSLEPADMWRMKSFCGSCSLDWGKAMLVLPLAIFCSAQKKSYLCADFQQTQLYASGIPKPQHKHGNGLGVFHPTVQEIYHYWLKWCTYGSNKLNLIPLFYNMWPQNTFSTESIYILLLVMMSQTEKSYIRHVRSMHGCTSCTWKEFVNFEKLVTVFFLSASFFLGFPCRCRKDSRVREHHPPTHSRVHTHKEHIHKLSSRLDI